MDVSALFYKKLIYKLLWFSIVTVDGLGPAYWVMVKN